LLGQLLQARCCHLIPCEVHCSHLRCNACAGFVLFLVLTLVLIWRRPAPLASSPPRLAQVQDQLYQFARSNWDSARSGWANTRNLKSQLKVNGLSILPDIDSTAAQEARNFHHFPRNIDVKLGKAATGLLNINWPVKTWPVYVFTIGAMACLLTSATCHLFGCCAAHVSRFIWRFDYLGIAILIVCSFYPQTYYGKLSPSFCVSKYVVAIAIAATVKCVQMSCEGFSGSMLPRSVFDVLMSQTHRLLKLVQYSQALQPRPDMHNPPPLPYAHQNNLWASGES